MSELANIGTCTCVCSNFSAGCARKERHLLWLTDGSQSPSRRWQVTPQSTFDCNITHISSTISIYRSRGVSSKLGEKTCGRNTGLRNASVRAQVPWASSERNVKVMPFWGPAPSSVWPLTLKPPSWRWTVTGVESPLMDACSSQWTGNDTVSLKPGMQRMLLSGCFH